MSSGPGFGEVKDAGKEIGDGLKAIASAIKYLADKLTPKGV